jgi:hypothetical protein
MMNNVHYCKGGSAIYKSCVDCCNKSLPYPVEDRPYCEVCRHLHRPDQSHGMGEEWRPQYAGDGGPVISETVKVKIEPEESGYMCKGCNRGIEFCKCLTPAEWDMRPSCVAESSHVTSEQFKQVEKCGMYFVSKREFKEFAKALMKVIKTPNMGIFAGEHITRTEFMCLIEQLEKFL